MAREITLTRLYWCPDKAPDPTKTNRNHDKEVTGLVVSSMRDRPNTFDPKKTDYSVDIRIAPAVILQVPLFGSLKDKWESAGAAVAPGQTVTFRYADGGKHPNGKTKRLYSLFVEETTAAGNVIPF